MPETPNPLAAPPETQVRTLKPRNSVAVCRDWQHAANAQDAERLLSLSSPDIEMTGPRGSVRGHEALTGWLSRAGLTLETLRTFAGDDSVVMLQRAVWRSPPTAEKTGEADLATRFVVSSGCVAELSRYDTEDALDIALREASLGYGDEL